MWNKTYLDSCVIINAVGADPNLVARARAILDDTQRSLMISDFVKLEIVPKFRYNKSFDKLKVVEKIIEGSDIISGSRLITLWAQSLAEFFGLAAMDALHAASAIIGKADELVTFEKPSKPFFRIPEALLNMVSLYE